MSLLDGSSFSRSFSFLALDFGVLENDPYRSRNTIASAQNAYNRGFHKNSQHVCDVGEGAVFKVSLRKSNVNGRLYAFKSAKKTACYTKGKSGSSAIGVFPVLREIQVVSHDVAKSHPNIVDVIGWDWSETRTPIVFVEYAELGSLKDFLQAQGSSLKPYEKSQLCLDIACGLNALHCIDIAHGDVKLANTLVFTEDHGAYKAKISDFSHSIFGLSSRRKSTYPGSHLYNAPEIRKRESMVFSDRLPRCETFSFGLLVWEVLKNGLPFFEEEWLCRTSTSASSSSLTTHEASLESLGKNGVLDKAKQFLSCSDVSMKDQPTFYHVFCMTLMDNPDLRADMQNVAMRLDEWDEGTILHYSHRLAGRTLTVWEFDPRTNIPWADKASFVDELQAELAQPVQPSHAEYHFVYSRCYAEGYGVERDLKLAVSHLYRSAALDSVEATCIIETWKAFFRKHQDQDLPMLANNEFSNSMKMVRSKAVQDAFPSEPHILDIVPLAAYIRSWNKVNGDFVKSRAFFWHDGTEDLSYGWNMMSIRKFFNDVTRDGQLCDAKITYASLDSPFNSGSFYEVCATYDLPGLFEALERSTRNLEDYTNSSWGDLNEVYTRLLNAAARGGRKSIIERFTSERPFMMEWTSPTGESPLHFLAFLEGSLETINKLGAGLVAFLDLDVNIPITTRSWITPYGIEVYGTPLQMAIQARCLRSVKALIQLGADPCASFGNIPHPLHMAATLHLPEIVELLINTGKYSTDQVADSLRAIGEPTGKGWFDQALASSSKDHFRLRPDYFLRRDIYQTARALMGLNIQIIRDPIFSPHSDDIEILLSFWELSQKWREDLDGKPLIDSIRRGQRDPNVLLILIDLGLHPYTDNARYDLLSVIIDIWKSNPGDPHLRKLFELVLGKIEVKIANYTTTNWGEWVSAWPVFFKRFRKTDESGLEMPLIHFWTSESAVQAIMTLIEVSPNLVNHSICIPDSQGRSAVDVAIDKGSKDLYIALRRFGNSHIDEDIERARRNLPNPLLPTLLAIRIDEQEMASFDHIYSLIKAQSGDPFRWPHDVLRQISDKLEEFADWAIKIYQWGADINRILMQPKEKFRRHMTVIFLLTVVRLRMITFQVKDVNELESSKSTGRKIPMALMTLYGFRGVGTDTGLISQQVRKLTFTSKVQEELNLFEKNTIVWTYLRQYTRVGPRAVIEWIQKRHYKTLHDKAYEIDEEVVDNPKTVDEMNTAQESNQIVEKHEVNGSQLPKPATGTPPNRRYLRRRERARNSGAQSRK